MKGNFTYQPLESSKREIRLLEVLPIHRRRSKSIPACRMSHVSLNENSDFTALSYVWGDPSNKRVILVDDCRFYVTRNLYDALMGLEQPESLVIWIDAICINQEDNAEKAWQVGLMNRVYEQATEVIAWLGKSANNSDKVIDHLNVLGEKAEACGLHDGPWCCMHVWKAMIVNPLRVGHCDELFFDGELLPASTLALERLLHSISGFKSQKRLLEPDNLKHLYQRAWWGRVWVLQEITLPKRAHLVCGTRRISRERFRAAYNAYYALCVTLQMEYRQPLSPYQTGLVNMAFHRVQVMLSMSQIYRIRRYPLVALLRATTVESIHKLKSEGYQHLESTDKRDKIFALLGLAKDKRQLRDLGVSPDYNKPEEEVYTKTMAALLQQGHVSLLSTCRASGRSSSLPSWVPDWSVPRLDTLQDVRPDHVTLCPQFNACGGKIECLVDAPFGKHGLGTISIMANICDEILESGQLHRVLRTTESAWPVQWLTEILRLSYISEDVYSGFKERFKTVVRVSHAGTGVGPVENPRQKVDRFLDAVLFLKTGIHIGLPKGNNLQLLKFLRSDEVKRSLKGHCSDTSVFSEDLNRTCSRRSPFVTTKGHLGVGSIDLKKGDVVALIGGAQVPFVLRKCADGKYQLVTEAYVEGIMDGEAAENGRWEFIDLI